MKKRRRQPKRRRKSRRSTCQAPAVCGGGICKSTPVRVVAGKRLCWTHAKVILDDVRTLSQVLSGKAELPRMLYQRPARPKLRIKPADARLRRALETCDPRILDAIAEFERIERRIDAGTWSRKRFAIGDPDYGPLASSILDPEALLIERESA